MISRLRWEIRRSNRWSQSTVEWEITRSNRWLESRVQMRWQSSLRFRGYIFIWIVLVGGLPSFYCFWNVFSFVCCHYSSQLLEYLVQRCSLLEFKMCFQNKNSRNSSKLEKRNKTWIWGNWRLKGVYDICRCLVLVYHISPDHMFEVCLQPWEKYVRFLVLRIHFIDTL